MTAPAPPPRIEPATADDAAAVLAGLRAFNHAACGTALDDQPLHRVIRDADGVPCAGLVADVYGKGTRPKSDDEAKATVWLWACDAAVALA